MESFLVFSVGWKLVHVPKVIQCQINYHTQYLVFKMFLTVFPVCIVVLSVTIARKITFEGNT